MTFTTSGPTSLIAPSIDRPKSQSRRLGAVQQISIEISRSLSVSSLFLLGALVQGGLLLLFSRSWVLAPALIILSIRFIDALTISWRLRANPYLEGVIQQNWTVNIPDRNGEISKEPASEKVAVLLLCAKSNHPLGSFAPFFKELGDYAAGMAIELDQNAENNGFLGQSEWAHTDPNGVTELMLLSYWRSIEDIHKYAESPLHTKAVKWWDTTMHKDRIGLQHIGIDHEIFEAPKRRWEKISINFQPTRLGATTYFRKGDKLIGGVVEDRWISPVIAAKGKFKTSRGRLQQDDGADVGVWTDRPLVKVW